MHAQRRGSKRAMKRLLGSSNVEGQSLTAGLSEAPFYRLPLGGLKVRTDQIGFAKARVPGESRFSAQRCTQSTECHFTLHIAVLPGRIQKHRCTESPISFIASIAEHCTRAESNTERASE